MLTCRQRRWVVMAAGSTRTALLAPPNRLQWSEQVDQHAVSPVSEASNPTPLSSYTCAHSVATCSEIDFIGSMGAASPSSRRRTAIPVVVGRTFE